MVCMSSLAWICRLCARDCIKCSFDGDENGQVV